MTRKKLRVLVCGVTFGRMYIKGVLKCSDKFELAGILSTGSAESKLISKKYNVPLYTSICDLQENEFDLACVVIRSTIVGGMGTEIAIQLLDKGISVLQEQPVHYDDLMQCLKIVSKRKVMYYVNNFYRDLDIMKKMFDIVNELRKKSKIISIDVVSSVQVLFPILDILGEILEGFVEWDFSNKIYSENYPYSIINGHIHNVPILFQIQNHINSSNPDNDALVLYRIIINFDIGTLILTDTNGNIMWIPRIFVLKGDMDRDVPDNIKKFPSSQLIYTQPFENLEEIYEYAWPGSIKNTLLRIYPRLIEKNIDTKITQRQIVSAKIWSELGNILGASEEVPEYIKYKDSFMFDNI